MIIVELTEDDQFGPDGPQSNDVGILIKKSESDFGAEDDTMFGIMFCGYKGMFWLDSLQFRVLEYSA